MKVSSLLKNLQNYMDMYGDQSVTVHNRDDGEAYPIVEFDALKNVLVIHISIGDEE